MALTNATPTVLHCAAWTAHTHMHQDHLKTSRCRHYSSCVLLCARYKSNWHVCIYMACRNGLFNQKTVNCHVALRWLLLSHCQNSCSSFSGHSRYIVMLYCDPFIISMQNRSYVGCGQSLLVFIDPFIPA